MRRFVEGIDREQATLFPEYLEDWIDRENPGGVLIAILLAGGGAHDCPGAERQRSEKNGLSLYTILVYILNQYI